LESAIPAHLTVPRTRLTRVHEDFVPPYPSFVARQAGSVRQVVMAYLGVQHRATPPGAGLAWLDEALAGPDGPGHHDRSLPMPMFAADGVPADVVTAAYWDDPSVFDRWFQRHREPWLTGGDGEGRWIEVIRPRVEEYETIFGARSRPEGIAVLAEGFSDTVREHGYWGGMRDRIPASQTDPLHDPGPLDAERDGTRVRIRPRGSVCLIRSGQDWTDTGPDERRTYLDVIEPNLRAGMEFLRDDGLEIGCLHNRYLAVVDDAGNPTDATYGLSWWRSLADLERWAESHPTHLAIFGAFGRMVSDQGGRTRLRLYHEVSVAGPDAQWFEYEGCHDGTGLLGACPA
jgi:aldoxime dehydratase